MQFKNEARDFRLCQAYVIQKNSSVTRSHKSLYDWKTVFHQPEPKHQQDVSQAAEIRRLKAELVRVTEERDILKKSNGVLRKRIQVKYAFIQMHRSLFRVRPMCRILKVHHSGFYAWAKEPLSNKSKDDNRLTSLFV